MISALSAIALVPSRAEKLFCDHKRNDQGIYNLTLYINGEKQEIMIDDYMVLNPLSKPAFSRTRSDKLWVSLVEKAWAKIHGSFASTEDGNAAVTLHDLTGAPTFNYKIKLTDNMMSLIDEAI